MCLLQHLPNAVAANDIKTLVVRGLVLVVGRGHRCHAGAMQAAHRTLIPY